MASAGAALKILSLLQSCSLWDSVNMKNPMWFTPNDAHRRDLDGKTVRFELPKAPGFYTGIGFFRVRGDCVNKMAVDIVVDRPAQGFEELLHLSPGIVEQIEDHPDQSVASFSLKVRI
jgi:hypothetical protein